jgi:DNA mismatch repair protein MutS2
MREGFAESALAAIEFHAALDLVADHAVSALGAARVRALRPQTDPWMVAHELDRVEQYAVRLDAGDDLAPEPFADVSAALERLRLEGSVLEGAELAELGRVLAAARQVHGRLTRVAQTAPLVAALAAPVPPRELEVALETALEPDGLVRDAASRDLARARHDVREVRETLVRKLGAIAASLDSRLVPPDATPTLRGGRYVIPVRREARARLGGIVHDESATHATLFVEPAEAIELGNQLREAEAAEAREVMRVLRSLTDRLRPHADALDADFEMLTTADCCSARARFALAAGASRPQVAAGGSFAIVKGAHPLLLRGETQAVPFQLVLEPEERTVLVSGPNTGGKTVLLKAVGLIVTLAQSGVIPPVGPATRLPVFAKLFADIGDRQSIQESLSTFSAHVAAIKDVLEGADARSLVLLDELGTGTDPAEGAALAGSVLRALTARGATTIATTHLGSLKELAEREPGIVNGSLQFDAATLTPTFRFTKGIPGRSYGLAIARRLGVDPAVLEEAERALPADLRALETTLAQLEARIQEVDRREADVAARTAELDVEDGGLARARAELAAREEEVRRREKELERTAKRAQRAYLLEARAEVEKAIALARDTQREREARRLVEEAIAATAAREDSPLQLPDLPAGPVSPGDQVRIASLGIEGKLEAVQGNEATVLVRGRRVRVPAATLSPVH